MNDRIFFCNLILFLKIYFYKPLPFYSTSKYQKTRVYRKLVLKCQIELCTQFLLKIMAIYNQKMYYEISQE